MPLPLILGIGAAIAGATGIGAGIHGGVKMKDAQDTMKSAERKHARSQQAFQKSSDATNGTMDRVGKLELEILNSFGKFSDTIEKIQNRPSFKSVSIDGVSLPTFEPEKLREVSVGAGVLLGGLGGAAVGTAGGFAAAGATTAAVMALGTASTGTAIASLSGIAATNATLAALGGGAIAAGGGGIALGTTILGAATLGVGLLVGGVIFNFTGNNLSDKADEAWAQAKKEEETVGKICAYLDDLKSTAENYTERLQTAKWRYQAEMRIVQHAVDSLQKRDWNEFTESEKRATENAVLLVTLLYNMCKVKLVKKGATDKDLNSVNHKDVQEQLRNYENTMAELDRAA